MLPVSVSTAFDEEKFGITTHARCRNGKTRWVNTGSKKVRRSYQVAAKKRKHYFEQAFSKSGSGSLSTRVDESYVKKLLVYFKGKSK